MTDRFPLPQGFRKRIISTRGAEGEAWLLRLPNLVGACAERWSLALESRVADLSYNFAALVVTADGTPAVLKIGVPDPELRGEIAALRALRGRSVVDLLAADDDLGALLLRRLVPGTPLSDEADDDEATLIGARLMRDLPVTPLPDHPFPTIRDWAQAFDRLRARFDGKTGPLSGPMLDKAERLLRELRTSSHREALLHGDVHHDNILFDRDGGWMAIDPKGVIGDPAYEAARFQHNPIPGFLSMDRPGAVVLRRVEILSSILQEEQGRLLAWAFFDAVLAACWSMEEGAEDWRYFVACAELFDGMV